jgi:GTP-binding protein EngB required for normal cell division
LQSKEGRDILDIIDSLRSQGISQYVDLPQICVCGDQSSGKSSVLEAISGVAFPTKDALCTRFATELILRRSLHEQDEGMKVSIIPGRDRSSTERQVLEEFDPDMQELDIGLVLDLAMDVMMGLSGTNRVLCTDILRVEISSPQQPHLTLVDLPGLFLAGNKDQSVEDAKLVERLVLSYMEQPRSIILAVVSAKSEFALQQITQRAREVDPEGHRTLGLITKPDTLDAGSESERAYFELVQNKDVYFRLGWHAVQNRDFNMRHATNAQRDVAERHFFSSGVWASLSPSQLGVDALRARLSRVLQKQIMTHLPQVLNDIQSGITECETTLNKLGASRESVGDQRRYLLHSSQAFTSLVKASIEGNYTDRSFFEASKSPGGFKKRLRAQVHATLTKFAQSMRLRGHAKTIVDKAEAASETSQPIKVTRASYAQEVNTLLQRN